MKIVHDPTVANSKAFLFLLEEYVDLVKQGFADNELAFANNSFCSYALNDDVVIGACAWMIDHNKRAAWILFSAVSKDHRRQGVYSTLLKDVERVAKDRGAAAIYSGVHVDNAAMISAATKAGRSLSWYRVKKML